MASSAICGPPADRPDPLRRRGRTACAWALVLALALLALAGTARPATAQPHRSGHHPTARPDDHGRAPAADPDARSLAQQGFAAYDRKDYAAAIQLFARANQLDPAPGLLFNIAQSYRQLGSAGCAPALEYYQRYLDALTDRGRHGPESVRARIVEMKACVDAHDHAGAGAGQDQAGSAPPGTTRPGDRDGDRARPRPAPAGGGPHPASVPGRAALVAGPTPPDPGARARRRAGWIVVSGGGAALATAAVTGLLAIERESSLSSRCDATVCPSSLASDVTSYNRLRVTAVVSGAIGAAAVATGVWLLVSSHSREASSPAARPQAARHVTPWIGRHSAGLAWTF